MLSFDVNREWHDVEQAERDRKKLEMQLQAKTLRAAELDRAPQVKLGPSASAMERKAKKRAREHGMDCEPATERGEGIQEAQGQLSLAEDARERFDAARTAYSEAREIGFGRVRSAYEAAREAFLFGVEPSFQQSEPKRERPEIERSPMQGLARMESRERGRESQQRRELKNEPERAPTREASVWDALDDIGRERGTPQEQSVSSDAMARVQQRTAEQQRERETEEAERQRLEREKQEREQERQISIGSSYGL